jgi:hypothetical protein
MIKEIISVTESRMSFDEGNGAGRSDGDPYYHNKLIHGV